MKSAGSILVQSPFGPRKSGTPDSVEMPAPVKARIGKFSRSMATAASRSATTESGG